MRSSKWIIKDKQRNVADMFFCFSFPVSKECVEKILSLVEKDEKVYQSETKDMNGEKAEIDIILKNYVEIKEKIEEIKARLKVDLNRGVLQEASFDKLLEDLNTLGQKNYALTQEKICNLIIKE